jgi:hypothetical protein
MRCDILIYRSKKEIKWSFKTKSGFFVDPFFIYKKTYKQFKNNPKERIITEPFYHMFCLN